MNWELATRSPAYGWMMLAGIAVTIVFWSRLAKRDERLLVIYVACLIGAFLGAKAFYFLAEGWLDLGRADRWPRLATGKSILGALVGGYASVELAKKMVRYPGVTGDWFAIIAPIGIIIGRVGCLLHGCCLGAVCAPSWFTLKDAQGITRWPAVPVEMLFNLIALAAFFLMRRRQQMIGQHFHLYLIAYGIFRLAHEFFRDTPRLAGPVSGYQLAALAVAVFGGVRFWQRRHRSAAFTPLPRA